MKALSRIHRRLAVLFSRNRFDRDLEEEIQNHIEMQAEENQELGMPTGEAYAAARRRLGNITLWKEISREVWGWAAIERLGQDLVYALRLLRRNPSFSTAAILTLALAIGLNTAIFSILNTVVLRPLPFQQPDRLVLIQEHFPKMDANPFGVSAPDCVKFQTQNRVFEDTAAFKDGEVDLSGTGEAERIRRGRVSAGLFRLL
ncbi:MAG TPA: permease prefix domain 1-containing protein, partial [Bryobacteraceae bacterium]|nr:permease prefix domain 1-containing protein [Bryobacteraceae bacterium]